MGTGVHSRASGDRGMMLTTHLCLGPRLRLSGATPLLPVYAFMTWTSLPIVSFPLLVLLVFILIFSCIYVIFFSLVCLYSFPLVFILFVILFCSPMIYVFQLLILPSLPHHKHPCSCLVKETWQWTLLHTRVSFAEMNRIVLNLVLKFRQCR